MVKLQIEKILHDKKITKTAFAEMLGITDIFVAIPPLTPKERKALRACQVQAIEGLESSFRTGREKALMVLATGAGKTTITKAKTRAIIFFMFFTFSEIKVFDIFIQKQKKSLLAIARWDFFF